MAHRSALRRPLAALAGAVLLVAVAAAPLACHAADDAITVTPDQRLARGCHAWTPRGLSFFGRLVPRGWATDPGTMKAQQAFSAWTVDAVKSMGGDTMRLQVGLPFLDPRSPQSAPGYLEEVKDAVALARGAGLAVILSMQWEGRTNVRPVEMIPAASSLRAWGVLGPAFASDPGVMFELFNEPASPSVPTPGHWRAWREGHQAIIDALRRAGVRNVLLVDGLNGARTFDGAPPLADPLGRLAYAVHPYAGPDLRSADDVERRFGRFARSHAMVATEWSHGPGQCAAMDAEGVARLLDDLAARRIGVVGYGADEQAGRLMRGGPAGRFRLTTFAGRACDDRDAGPGELLRDAFAREQAADAAAPPVPAAACASVR